MRMTEEEFEIKYKQYSQILFNIAFTYMKDYDNAFDIVQEVFIKYLNTKEFKNEDHEKNWLIRVTINQCKNEIKKIKKIVYVEPDKLNVVSDSSPNNSDQSIFNLISLLNDKYKIVIILFYYDNLSIKQIAAALKISESAVKMRLTRAREILRKMEEKYDR